MRLHVVSVRLTPEEWAAWREAAVAAGSKEVATWARGVAAASVPRGLGSMLRPTVSNWGASTSSSGIGAGWNDAVRILNSGGELELIAVHATAGWAGELDREARPTVEGSRVDGWTPTGKQSELVNIRLSKGEQWMWELRAVDDGWERPGAWCRAMVGASIGIAVTPSGLLPVSDGAYLALMGDLVGIVNNLGQAIAHERVSEDARAQLVVAQVQVQAALARLHAARVP